MNDKLNHSYEIPAATRDARNRMVVLHDDWRNAPSNERGPLYVMYDEARAAYLRQLVTEMAAIRAQLSPRERELLDRTRSIINTIGGLS